MPISEAAFPQRLTQIDDLTRPDHHYLVPGDACLFFGEYTARAGFAFSPMNSLIHNFKKPMDRRGRPEWRYKDQAIEKAAAAFTAALNPEWLRSAALVPMPPSKAKNDPLHDDRVLRMVSLIGHPARFDVRELLYQTESRDAAHDGARPGPDELERLYAINEQAINPVPQSIGLFDDTLVTGSGFRAAQAVLRRRFPGAQIFGFFIARRVSPPMFEAVDD